MAQSIVACQNEIEESNNEADNDIKMNDMIAIFALVFLSRCLSIRLPISFGRSDAQTSQRRFVLTKPSLYVSGRLIMKQVYIPPDIFFKSLCT